MRVVILLLFVVFAGEGNATCALIEKKISCNYTQTGNEIFRAGDVMFIDTSIVSAAVDAGKHIYGQGTFYTEIIIQHRIEEIHISLF